MIVTRPSPANLSSELSVDRHVPVDLVEQVRTRMFPQATLKHLHEIRSHGWARLGISAAIVNEMGEILMLDHAESRKLTEGMIGPLTETTKVNLVTGAVESTEQTIHRGVVDELKIAEPEQLKLRARVVGAWTLQCWPAGDKIPDEISLGVNTVLRIPDEKASQIVPFINSDEIRRARFMTAEEIAAVPKLRPGVHEWLGWLTTSGLLEVNGAYHHPVNFSGAIAEETPGWQDAILADL